MLFDFLIQPPFMTIPFLNGGEPRRGGSLSGWIKKSKSIIGSVLFAAMNCYICSFLLEEESIHRAESILHELCNLLLQKRMDPIYRVRHRVPPSVRLRVPPSGSAISRPSHPGIGPASGSAFASRHRSAVGFRHQSGIGSAGSHVPNLVRATSYL
jgi:hypothetical protein